MKKERYFTWGFGLLLIALFVYLIISQINSGIVAASDSEISEVNRGDVINIFDTRLHARSGNENNG